MMENKQINSPGLTLVVCTCRSNHGIMASVLLEIIHEQTSARIYLLEQNHHLCPLLKAGNVNKLPTNNQFAGWPATLFPHVWTTILFPQDVARCGIHIKDPQSTNLAECQHSAVTAWTLGDGVLPHPPFSLLYGCHISQQMRMF